MDAKMGFLISLDPSYDFQTLGKQYFNLIYQFPDITEICPPCLEYDVWKWGFAIIQTRSF